MLQEHYLILALVGAGVGLGLVLIGALIPNDSLFVPIFIKVIDKKENKEFLVDGLAATDPLTYDKKFMSDEISKEFLTLIYQINS